MVSFMNTNSKERGNSTLMRRRTRSPDSLIFTFYTGSLHMTSCCLCSKVVNNISRNFNCVIVRPRDMQEYILMFKYCIRMEINIQILYSDLLILNTSFFKLNTHVYLFCVLHHWTSFTREWHGTATA